MHVTNQSAIYVQRPEARSRLNTAYMVCYFLGGAIFSATARSVRTCELIGAVDR